MTIACILFTLYWGYVFFYKKIRYSAITYIWLGIILPLFLYQLDWSTLIDKANSPVFNYTLVSFMIIAFFYGELTQRKKINPINNKKIKYTSFAKQICLILNIGFIILYLVENYLGSRTLFPGLRHIDIHTYSAPLISYITNNPFIIISFDYYMWKSSRKKKYWIWILLIFTIPVVTRSSRMQIMICFLQFISLFLFTEGSNIVGSIKAKKHYKRIVWLTVLVGFGVGIILIFFTNYRMNHYGKYDLNYAKLTGFSGPEWLSFLAPYYGYFPLSFNNLKINLLYNHVKHNYIGLYSFACIYFGVFQLDNISGISSAAGNQGKLVTQSAATVSTGFWTYYYDFNYLLFIPVIIAFLVCYILLKNACNEKYRLTYRTLYFWYVCEWFFMSFQNTMFQSTLLVSGIIFYFIIKHSFYLTK